MPALLTHGDRLRRNAAAKRAPRAVGSCTIATRRAASGATTRSAAWIPSCSGVGPRWNHAPGCDNPSGGNPPMETTGAFQPELAFHQSFMPSGSGSATTPTGSDFFTESNALRRPEPSAGTATLTTTRPPGHAAGSAPRAASSAPRTASASRSGSAASPTTTRWLGLGAARACGRAPLSRAASTTSAHGAPRQRHAGRPLAAGG